MDKPFEITFEDRPGYLYAHIRSETIDPERTKAFLSQIAARCDESECERLMMVRDIPEIIPEVDIFFVVQGFLEKVRGKKVAIVNPHASIDAQLKFAVMISTNRGGRFSFHKTAESAEKWLLEDYS